MEGQPDDADLRRTLTVADFDNLRGFARPHQIASQVLRRSLDRLLSGSGSCSGFLVLAPAIKNITHARPSIGNAQSQTLTTAAYFLQKMRGNSRISKPTTRTCCKQHERSAEGLCVQTLLQWLPRLLFGFAVQRCVNVLASTISDKYEIIRGRTPW